jgi:hypothetical protein
MANVEFKTFKVFKPFRAFQILGFQPQSFGRLAGRSALAQTAIFDARFL